MVEKNNYVLPTWLVEMIVKNRYTSKYRLPKKYSYAVVKNGKISFFKWQ